MTTLPQATAKPGLKTEIAVQTDFFLRSKHALTVCGRIGGLS